ncbi:hypothetical protein EMCRGX_G008403 [Ephydatia muelleri]
MAAGKFVVEMSTLGDSIGAAVRRGVGKLKSVFSKKPSGDRVTSIAYNLLLIGETGSGKTSFLNLLCNFNEVLQHGFDQAISQKRLRRFNDHQKEDLEALEMQSKTGQTSHYTIEIDGLTLGIIDTPGFGDTRGIEHDKKNVKNIVDKVNAVMYIHCICLVMNGRQSRLTHQLKYVVSEISAILPKSCVYNMIVVLTNVRDSYETSFRLEELVPYLGEKKTVIDETKKATFDKAEKSIQDLDLQLQTMLDETLKLAEEQIEQHRKDLYNKINNFEEMASTPNYIMLLECEIKLIEHRIAHEQRSATATSSSGAGHLIKAKEHMEGLLHVVKDATKNKPSEESPISLNIASH